MQVSAQGVLLGVNCNLVRDFTVMMLQIARLLQKHKFSRLSVKLQAESRNDCYCMCSRRCQFKLSKADSWIV